MQTTLLAAFLFTLSTPAQAGRTGRLHWLEHQVRWCMEDVAVVECDDASIIHLGSAFYSGARKLKGRTEKCGQLAQAKAGDCGLNFTKEVWELCHRQRKCQLEPSFHSPACAQQARSMRIVWDCRPGKPKEAKEPQVAAPDEEEDDEEAVHPPEKLEPGEKAEKLVEEISKEPEHNVSFTPCWRKAEEELGGLLAILPAINCPKDEDCFKLSWPDGRAFVDNDHPPTGADLVGASLKKSPPRPIFRMEEWNTLDLEWNDERSWGICLPKKKGLEFAVGVFNAVQTTQKKSLTEELAKNPQVKVTFTPCWRKDPGELVGLLAILPPTNCPQLQDCYMLTFPNGKTFGDEEHPPVLADVKSASLTSMMAGAFYTASYIMPRFGPVNLKWNLPKTWGVCLPSQLGTSFAMAAFSAMKSLP